ncbi:hypothetical protein F2P81_001491 [Scophthalmus maximus]|uniref:Uncharacterized protein n=1 Tax=Scophthalmus maximus TaxID=52904 RepID=A0A6A4TSD5_SCOMX|nr:hypothetical protein F2P81_001491 [Scophthalmus maximus]
MKEATRWETLPLLPHYPTGGDRGCESEGNHRSTQTDVFPSWPITLITGSPCRSKALSTRKRRSLSTLSPGYRQSVCSWMDVRSDIHTECVWRSISGFCFLTARLRPLLYFSAAETPSHSELTAAASFSVAHRQRSPINSAARLLAHSRPPVTTSPPSFRNFTVAPCPTAIPLQSQTRSSIAPLMPSLPVTSAQDRAQDLGATAPSPTLAPPSGTVSTLKSDCIDLSIFKTILQKPTSSKLMMLILYTVC